MRPDLEVEGVVWHVDEIIRGEQTNAHWHIDVSGHEIESIRAFEPILPYEAAKPRERIAHLRERAVGGLLEQRVEIAFVEQPALPEHPHAPVDASRLVQIERGTVHVVDQIAEAVPLKRRQR